MPTVGLVGLGQMGGPMGLNLLKSGFSVRSFDLVPAALEALEAAGAEAATSARDAARGADFVITMLPNGAHVEEAVFGDNGIVQGISPEALFIDMSTILPSVTDNIARRLGELGIAMVDAPVGRTSAAAITGTLLIMAGGDEKDIERARPLFEVLGDEIHRCGPVGSGTRMKLVNNYMTTVLNMLTAETLALAEANGLPRNVTLEVLRGTPAGRGHLNTTYPAKVLKGDVSPDFMLDLALKDLGLALEVGVASGVPLATGAAARAFYVIAHGENRGREDWTALFETVRSLSGITK